MMLMRIAIEKEVNDRTRPGFVMDYSMVTHITTV